MPNPSIIGITITPAFGHCMFLWLTHLNIVYIRYIFLLITHYPLYLIKMYKKCSKVYETLQFAISCDTQSRETLYRNRITPTK